MIPVSIVILSHNQLNYSKKCLNSIKKNTSYPYNIYWVDNNSTDGTVEWLKSTNVNYILNNKNLGFAKAVNMGMKAAGENSHIMFLNNDTVVTDSWLNRLVSLLESGDNIGGVGPVSCHCASAVQKILIPSSKQSLNIDGFAARRFKEFKGKTAKVPNLIGFCSLWKKEVVKKVGFLDETFYMSGEDLDYSRRVRGAGFELMVALDVYVHHFGHVTANNQTTFNCNVEWARGVVEFKKKWKEK